MLIILILALFTSISSAEEPIKKGKPGNFETRNVQAPLLAIDSSNAIPGQYIVVFNKETNKKATNKAKNQVRAMRGVAIQREYTVINGFAARLSDKAVDALRNNPNVAYIEADQIVNTVVTWGLDRTDQRNLPLNNTYNSSGDYNGNGSGVHAYIIDTGIRSTHTQFTGRVGNGYDAVDGGSPDDCNGHGTHVAG